MLKDQNLVDVIISCDGNNIRAHRLVLSANSSYFKSLFETITSPCQTPVIVLKDVPLIDLKAIIEFMYRGEVLVQEKQLSSVLKSAELLKVFGLTEVCLALRSRLINEGSVADQSSPASGPSAQKRPRISDGVNQTTQQSSDALFSRLSNARFEIRPTSNQSQNSQSSQQQLRTITSSLITSKTPAVVKNVILPTSQIHTRPQSTNTQILSTTETINIAVQPISVSNPSENRERVTKKTTKSAPNSTPTTSVTNQTSTPFGANVQAISPKRISTSTWTPTQHSLSHTLLHSPSTSRDKRKTPPIEVIIDDEAQDTTQQYDSDVDIKPPIFEINESICIEKEITSSEIISETSKKDSQIKTSVSTVKPNDSSKEEIRTSRSSIKSRTSSTSSQSLPPPPTYRVVQRSSSRLLRNIIRPPSSLSPSTVKTKESEDKSKLKKVKKERQFVGLVKFKKNKTNTNSSSSSGDTPEIECPSCGQIFNDEQNWNEHIANVHLPFQT